MPQKTILITGATGFLGSHLARQFLLEGHQIIILKRSFSNIWRINKLFPHLKSYDIDRSDLEQVFRENKNIDIIIHTATCYGKNGENMSDILQINTLFPLKLLELAINYNVQFFFNTDTYFNKKNIPYQGLPFYSLSKEQFLNWGKQVSLMKKIRFFNLRLEHPFGEKDDSSKFTTYIINSCLQNIPFLDLTKGEQKRDFIYIKDVVFSYSFLFSQLEETTQFYEEYEIGTGKAMSIKEFVQTVYTLTNSSTKLNFGVLPYRDNEIMFSQADTEKLQQSGWQFQYSVKQALQQIIDIERELIA